MFEKIIPDREKYTPSTCEHCGKTVRNAQSDSWKAGRCPNCFKQEGKISNEAHEFVESQGYKGVVRIKTVPTDLYWDILTRKEVLLSEL
jgi:hypothetical protein